MTHRRRPFATAGAALAAWAFCVPSWAMPVAPAAPASAPAPTSSAPFSWAFGGADAAPPRGGITQGAPLRLDPAPSAAWAALQQPGLDRFEKDRRAILAMAGSYRASFEFVEVAGFTPGFKPDRPYRSWGTEKVYVVEDTGTTIVLQHLLVMSMVGQDGQVHGPFVTKHWRQDWAYEPTHRIVYRGGTTWQRIEVPPGERRGRWSQTVYQVDDSPRYSGLAAWQHLANHASWADDDGWRPLPRREFSVRSDYQLLIGSNRHTIVPTGWIHEQHNLKAVLDAGGTVQAIVGRELGFNRYERLSPDFDFSAGDRYLQTTAPVWAAVRREWARLFAERGTLRLKGAPDQDGLFVPLYEYAADAAESPPSPERIERDVKQRVADYLD